MSFKEYEPQGFFNPCPLEQGYASIDKNGSARFWTTDLELVNITDQAVILTDELTLRIAIRAARPGDGRKAMEVARIIQNKKERPDRRLVRLRGAIRDMNLEPEAVAGRYSLTTKENLLIINLADGESELAAKRKELQ